jgi:hypothetical protein
VYKLHGWALTWETELGEKRKANPANTNGKKNSPDLIFLLSSIGLRITPVKIACQEEV